METKKFEELLLSVQKPGRYSGGEINSVIKDKHSVDVRFAFCFPDTYEIGMSNLGMRILVAECVADALLQDSPVATAPTVDRLFDVTHDQYRRTLRLCERILQQRQEIAPLFVRRILEFVDHKVLVTIAHFLVDKRGVVLLDKFR